LIILDPKLRRTAPTLLTAAHASAQGNFGT
jgi:hypothetical protein